MPRGTKTSEVAIAPALSVSDLLWSGVEGHQFRLVYQPILSFGRERVHSLEVLMRWEHPGMGTIPPSMFVHVAEELGAMSILGEMALRDACEKVASLNRLRPESDALGLSVNIARTELLDQTLPDRVEAALGNARLPASRLTLDIAEESLESDSRRVALSLHALSSTGVQLAIDNFGTTSACIGSLAHLPVDQVKIASALAGDLARDGRVAVLISGLVDLVQGLGMTVVIEGLESEQDASAASATGADFGQGYFFAVPTESNDVPWMLERLGGRRGTSRGGLELAVSLSVVTGSVGRTGLPDDSPMVDSVFAPSTRLSTGGYGRKRNSAGSSGATVVGSEPLSTG